MAKSLPCLHCRRPAQLPDGGEYRLSSHPAGQGTFTYKCARCKHKTSIRASEFNRLPEAREMA